MGTCRATHTKLSHSTPPYGSGRAATSTSTRMAKRRFSLYPSYNWPSYSFMYGRTSPTIELLLTSNKEFTIDGRGSSLQALNYPISSVSPHFRTYVASAASLLLPQSILLTNLGNLLAPSLSILSEFLQPYSLGARGGVCILK